MAVPYTFGSATTSIPLSQLDSNFATTITLGNTAVQLGNTITNLTGVSNVASATSLSLGSNGNTTAITVDTSQNVGIGTASPTTLLHLGGATNKSMRIDSATGNAAFLGTFQTFSVFSANRNPSTGAFADTGKASAFISLDANVSNGQIVFGTTASNNTEATERMRIDSSGNLLVGTTSSFGAGVTILPSGQVFASRVSDISGVFDRLTTDGQVVSLRRQGNAVGSISVTASATSYNTSSDYRLKENIAPMTGALAKVALLKPCTYKWNVDNSDGQGFIAHELQEVIPDCVTGTKDEVDADGNPKYQGIDTSFLVATLTAALQETKALIDAQAETINALTARIVALEAK